MRRLIVEEPVSRAAVWSARIAWFALALAAMAVLMARVVRIEPAATLAVFSGAVILACVAILLALAAFSIIWRLGRKGAGKATAGLVLALALLAYPAWLAAGALRLPLLNDVTTDIADPPGFARTRAAFEARGGGIPGDPGPAARALQQTAYRGLEPLVLEIDADAAYRLVVRSIQAIGWEIVHRAPPSGRLGLGHVDAVVKSRMLGFADDLTVRITPLAGRARIDVRSASRVGRHDFGANQRHIARLLDEMQTQLGAR